MGADQEMWAAVHRAAAARVESWIATRRPADAAGAPAAAAAAERDLLSGAREDADGFAFTRRLLETIVDVRDPFSAALGLRALSQELPDSLPAKDRLAMRAGGFASLGMPWAVLPAARRWLRDRVSHLVLSAKLPEADRKSARATAFRAALKPHRIAPGAEALLALQGEAVLGPDGVEREIQRLIGLARVPEVTHLAVDPGRIAPRRGASPGEWSLDADAELGAEAIRPLLEAARDSGTTIILEAHDFRGALLAPKLLARALTGGVIGARAGLHLPAELPESQQAAEAMIQLSRERARIGAEPLELTIQHTGLAAGAQIASVLTGHPVPTLEAHAARAQLLRLLDLALSAGDAIRIAIASEDPLLLSAVTLLAEQHEAAPPTLQLRTGTSTLLADALVEHDFTVRHRIPVVAPKEFDGVVGSLIHLAAEAADPGSDLARATAFARGELLAGESALAELRDAIEAAQTPFPPSHRVRERSREWDPDEQAPTQLYLPPTSTERFDTGGLTAAVLGLGRDETGQITIEARGGARRVPVISETGFANEPDTDAAMPANREWARGLLARASSRRGGSRAAEGGSSSDSVVGSVAEPVVGSVVGSVVDSADSREAVLVTVSRAAELWRAQRVSERATRVGRLSLSTASARDRLIEVLAAESGAPIEVLDADVSGVVDAARYSGLLAPGLARTRGAAFVPDGVVLIVAGAGIPLAERAEAALSALAAGSGVLLVAHPTIAQSTAVLIDEWEAAGLPAGAVTVAIAETLRAAHAAPPKDTAAQAELDPLTTLAANLAADTRIERALVLGHRPLARAIVRRRPELRVDGRFRTLGATIIGTSAETSSAVRGAVASALTSYAADANRAQAVILIGSLARSSRLRELLGDAVRGLRVGDSAGGSADPLAFDLGPLPLPPTTAGLRALTELQAGESWLVEPERLDDEGLLWQPGVRMGVRRDSSFWADAVGMPVIGVAAAGTLAEAIALQNELGGGAAALYANDPNETLPWLDGARAAFLALDRPTTRTRMERHPGGGWGDAGMGAAPLAGGPHRLTTLGTWQLRGGTPSATLHLRGLGPEVRAFIETMQASIDYPSFDRLRRAALADALTWKTSLGRVRDAIGLGVEWNLLRHWPVGTHIRLAEGGSLPDLARVLAAGLLVGAPMEVSTGGVLPAEVSRFLAMQGVTVALERDDDWLERLAVAGPGPDAERVRLIGGDPVRTAEWIGGRDRVPLWAEPVTMAGPVELLTFLREQAISVGAHRHGLVALPPGIAEWVAALDA